MGNTCEFDRAMKVELREKLKKEPLYERLLLDIKNSGDVFPAIRNERVDFYHKGGKLFSYDKGGFKTHVKYASAYKEHPDAYIAESMLKNLNPIQDFSDSYKRIKENCSLYSGVEAQGVSKIYGKYSYASKESANLSIVVLDIEISLKALDEDRAQDRIDLLLFEKEKKRLIFCEAKDFSNSEIWAGSGKKIKVVEQVERYVNQIKDKKDQIITAYNNYVKIVNNLFELTLPLPETICSKVPLIIFGFDRDQLKGRFNVLFEKEVGNIISYYPIGNVSGFNPENMVKKCDL
jgi:hypothetical protein